MFCITRLSLGCFYFQGELISSACAGVQVFFLPVTKSWKTPLNNISEHRWNKDRAWWEEEQLKPEIIAIAAASHHLQSPSLSDFPVGLVSACSAPLSFAPGLQGLALLGSKGEEDAEDSLRQQGTGLKAAHWIKWDART